MREKVRDYLDMGVREVWVVDAEARSIMVYAGATMVEQTTGELKVPETPVVLALADIFKGARRILALTAQACRAAVEW